MTGSTHDILGRPWAKLSEIKIGDVLTLDRGFTCASGVVTVNKDSYGMYFPCSHGKHYLAPDDGEHLIGVYKV